MIRTTQDILDIIYRITQKGIMFSFFPFIIDILYILWNQRRLRSTYRWNFRRVKLGTDRDSESWICIVDPTSVFFNFSKLQDRTFSCTDGNLNSTRAFYIKTRRMAIANGTCVSFCNQPKAHYFTTSRESRRYVVAFSAVFRLEAFRYVKRV